jgi:tetratricopeptide (TPR) repeat protein
MKIFEITEAKVEMCPEACCGKPVTECKCGPDCEHCDCHAKNKMNEDEDLGNVIKTGVKGSYAVVAKAIKDYEELIRNNPNHPKVPQVKAELAKLKPMLAKAQAGMSEASKNVSESPLAAWPAVAYAASRIPPTTYAGAATAIGTTIAKAIKHFEELIKKNPKHPKVSEVKAELDKLKPMLAKSQSELGETTTAGSVATVANPPSANAKIKRKNGAPVAPQKKNKDGTAKNALELGNNLMGGGAVKR